MSIIIKVINYITNDLNIKITEDDKNLIIKHFYQNIDDKIYWSAKIEYSFYEGLITKNEYEKIKKLPYNFSINFGEIAKHVYDVIPLKNFYFTDDINEITKLYDKGIEQSNNYFDLIEYLEEDI